uniref:Uncharacterized protein LOC114345958 n=1 Tax=Diabrotica virgifera virgifera TaxID=50390 RepID=A0A6P7GSR0_DIAVI
MLQRTALILNRAREITNEEKEESTHKAAVSLKIYSDIQPVREVEFNRKLPDIIFEEKGIRHETSSRKTYTNIEPLQEIDFNSATDTSEEESTHKAAVSLKIYSDIQPVREVEFNRKLPDIIFEV